jgi:hypothetical protein
MSTTIRTACLTALLALYGCGGGGSADGRTTPPVIDPAATLSLSGHVTDAAVPNAIVTAHVGSDTFTAVAMTDADGAFSVDIESSDDAALVSFEATDASGVVHFTSLPTTFGELAAQADADGNVSGVSITNLTTAHAVLVARATSDGSIDSMDELATVAPSVDSAELLQLAAAIKVVVENRAGVTLPTGVGDTLELAQAIADGSSTFLDDVETTSPGTLDTAADDVLTDGNATMVFSVSDAGGVYVDETSDITLALFNGGLGWMNAGGELRQIGSWHVDEDGRIYMLFPGGDHEVDSLTLLGQAGDYASVVADVSSLVDSTSQGHTYATYQHSAFGSFTAEELTDHSFVLANDSATALVFAADGTGYNADAASGAQQQSFRWQVLDGGQLVLEYDGAVVTVNHVGDGSDVLVVRTDAAGAASAVVVTQLDGAA